MTAGCVVFVRPRTGGAARGSVIGGADRGGAARGRRARQPVCPSTSSTPAPEIFTVASVAGAVDAGADALQRARGRPPSE